jgi:hypothetical protein
MEPIIIILIIIAALAMLLGALLALYVWPGRWG